MCRIYTHSISINKRIIYLNITLRYITFLNSSVFSKLILPLFPWMGCVVGVEFVGVLVVAVVAVVVVIVVVVATAALFKA